METDLDAALAQDPSADGKAGGESLLTVIVALVANALIALAKTVAAVLTGSASMVAEAAHSWADTGNEVFLLLAERRGGRPRDARHPRGYGRDTYVWSLFAAFGLLSAGAAVSVVHGIQQLGAGEPDSDYLVNYVVLTVAFVLEGVSFLQALRQAAGSARRWGLHPLSFINRTSDPTLRAVFVEDSSALLGLVFAAVGVGMHEITGNAVWDAVGSIAVGVLLAVVALFLIRRNHAFLVGESLDPVQVDRVLTMLLANPEIHRVTYLHLEYVGPLRFFVVAAIDLTGDDPEGVLAVRLRALEARMETHDAIEDAILTLSMPDEPSLTPGTSSTSATSSVATRPSHGGR